MNIGAHFLVFSTSKASVLIAPLLAATVLPKFEYGSVEWWLAISMVFAPVIGMGAGTVTAYGSLGGELKKHVNVATTYTIVVATLMLLLGCLILIFIPDFSLKAFTSVFFQSAVILLQIVLSARLKGLGKGAWASLAESTVYICLLVSLVFSLLGADFLVSYLGLLVFASICLCFLLSKYTSLTLGDLIRERNYIGFLRVGSTFMMGGALIGAFLAMPRISLGFLANEEIVASFALVFRWLSISIAIHQFMNTVLFKSIFGDSADLVRDKLLALTVLLVSVAVVFISISLKFGALDYFSIQLPDPDDLILVWPMSIVIVLWATTACFEGALYRQGKVALQIQAVSIGLLVQGAGLYFGMSNEVLLSAVYSWISGFVVMICLQYKALWVNGSRFPYLLSSLLASLAVLGFFIFVIG